MKTAENTIKWNQGCFLEDIQAANEGNEEAQSDVQVIRDLNPRQNSTAYVKCDQCGAEFQVSYTGIVRALGSYRCTVKPELEPATQDWVLNISQFFQPAAH